jgi:hypothetical protein
MSPLTIVPLLVILLRSIKLPLREYAAALFPSLAGSAAMCLSVLALRQWVLPVAWSPRITLAVQVAAGGAAYVAILLAFFRVKVFRYVRFMQDMRKGKNAPAFTPLRVGTE